MGFLPRQAVAECVWVAAALTAWLHLVCEFRPYLVTVRYFTERTGSISQLSYEIDVLVILPFIGGDTEACKMEPLAQGHKDKECSPKMLPPAGAWGCPLPPSPHSLRSLNGNGILIRCPHTPACLRLRDIPDPLFSPGSSPLPRGGVSGGKVPFQRGECSGSKRAGAGRAQDRKHMLDL